MSNAPDFLSVLSDAQSLQGLLFACPDGVVLTDADDRITLYTGASEVIFGFAPVDVLGQPLVTLFGSDADYQRFRQRLTAERSLVNTEVAAAHKYRANFTAAISAARLQDRTGGHVGTVLYVRDHTDMRDIEDTLRDSNRRLNDLVGTLDRVARHDQLTGLLNRGSAIEGIETFMLAAGPAHARFGVALFDIDHFKSVNDSYGHLVGDEVLAGVARVIARTARQHDLVARFGGEEFIAFLPAAGLAAVTSFAERVRRAVAAEQFRIDPDLTVTVTVSGGVSAVPGCAGNLSDAIRLADDHLLAAKQGGRNRVTRSPDEAERNVA